MIRNFKIRLRFEVLRNFNFLKHDDDVGGALS